MGDVVYYRDEEHHLGLEVKRGTIRLTSREFNEWIVRCKPFPVKLALALLLATLL